MMDLNLDDNQLNDLCNKYIEFNLSQYEKINKKYRMQTTEEYCLHALHEFKQRADAHDGVKLNISQRQAVSEIGLALATRWLDLYRVFEKDPEYTSAISKGSVFCQEIRKVYPQGPRTAYGLKKVFWACESLMMIAGI